MGILSRVVGMHSRWVTLVDNGGKLPEYNTLFNGIHGGIDILAMTTVLHSKEWNHLVSPMDLHSDPCFCYRWMAVVEIPAWTTAMEQP